MKREILFRGKRVDKEAWVEGDLIHGVGGKWGRMFILPRTHIMPKGCSELDGWEVIPETVGQLWIKSGKRLFGGDLFRAICSISGELKRSLNICKVCDSDEGFEVVIWHKNEWWHYNSMDFTSMQLIGNIHDNPDLLKQENQQP